MDEGVRIAEHLKLWDELFSAPASAAVVLKEMVYNCLSAFTPSLSNNDHSRMNRRMQTGEPNRSETTAPGILERIAAGDGTAVEECMAAYGGLIWTLSTRFCSTRADSEDATQDIFVELWRKANRFDPLKSSETTFVSMLARRRLIDRYRRQTTQPDTVSFAATESEPTETPLDTVELADEASKAARCLDRLDGDYRRVLKLSILQGCSHQTISHSIGMPLGTVKSLARRGLLQVRDCMRRKSAMTAGGVE